MNEDNIEVLDFDDNSQQNTIIEENKIEETNDILNTEINNNNNNTIQPENTNPSIKPNDNIKYHGYKYYVTNYTIICIISLVTLIIFVVGYSFSKESTLSYTENSTANYQVCLKNNNYYAEKCVSENIEYVSAITDNIRADFTYNKIYQEAQNKEFKYYIKSKLVINTDDEDSKELLKQEKKLTKEKKVVMEKNVLSISTDIEIPFEKYNQYADKYKSDFSLINRSNLYISLVVKENDQEKEVASINIPLTKLTYNITKTEIKNEIGSYEVETNSLINYLFIILIIVSLIVLLVTLVLFGKFLWKTRVKVSKYERKIRQILNTYDRVIITLEDKNTIVNDTEVYTVKTFLELLDVRDTVDKPILYYKVNNVKTEFYVQDVNKTYKYVMKESDFEDIK